MFHETAQSILQQSLQQWEWIIVNDGSTDAAALAVLAGYRQGDPCIRVIDHPQNRGLSAARNTRITPPPAATSLSRLDSDDLLEPTAVEKWLWFLLSYPAVRIRQRLFCRLWRQGIPQARRSCRRAGIPGSQPNQSYGHGAAHVHQAVGGYDEAMRDGMEDWEFWLRCANAGYWGAPCRNTSIGAAAVPIPTDRWAEPERQQAHAGSHRHLSPALWPPVAQGRLPAHPPPPHAAYAALPDTCRAPTACASRAAPALAHALPDHGRRQRLQPELDAALC